MAAKLGILIAIFLALVGFLQFSYDSNVDYFAEKDTFVSLPSGETLKILSFGHANLVADVLFIWSIQFYSTLNLKNRFDYIEQIFNVITDLNPQFRAAYYYGAIIMALEARETKMAIRLLQKGSRNMKNEWIFDYEAGYYASKFLQDPKLAEQFYLKASEKPGAPALIKRRRAHMVYMEDKLDLAYQLWMEIYHSAKTQLERDASINHLYQIKFEMDKIFLEKALELYKHRYHRYPLNLEQLKRVGFIKEIPRDYFGNDYHYDSKKGKVSAQRMFKWKIFS
jgi:hypothetical protein